MLSLNTIFLSSLNSTVTKEGGTYKFSLSISIPYILFLKGKVFLYLPPTNSYLTGYASESCISPSSPMF
jgi:hypothetical protein